MTEILWEGKYKDGKKAAPIRIALPFQTIETVNESTQQRQMKLDLFSSSFGGGRGGGEWRNRLIWGDKKYVLPSLLPEFADKVNLIYIDPSFDTGANDIDFLGLIVNVKIGKKQVPLRIDDFIISPDDAPPDVQSKITHWSQWIDYWAVDWNYRDDTFHNKWQSYRTKQRSELELAASHIYEQSGKYTVLVKVIDILGNDTTKAVYLQV